MWQDSPIIVMEGDDPVRKKPLFKMLSLYLVFATFLLSLPSQGWAMFITSGREAAVVKQDDLATVQKILESTMVKQRIMDFGLTPEEAMTRINKLSDDQIHRLAANLDSLQAGADGVDLLIFLVLLAILVVVIIKITGHTVIIK